MDSGLDLSNLTHLLGIALLILLAIGFVLAVMQFAGGILEHLRIIYRAAAVVSLRAAERLIKVYRRQRKKFFR